MEGEQRTVSGSLIGVCGGGGGVQAAMWRQWLQSDDRGGEVGLRNQCCAAPNCHQLTQCGRRDGRRPPSALGPLGYAETASQ